MDAATNPRAAGVDFVRFKRLLSRLMKIEGGLGLEIGPFDRPFFTKQEANVAFLDYRSTADLRHLAEVTVGHNARFVDEVDYVVPGSGLWTEVPNGAFDWILSNHAIEHSPNMIGFYRTMNEKLKPGGLVVTMLPDKRRTFDAYKPLTSLGRVFQDYFLGAKLSSFQAVFDGLYYNRPLTMEEADAVHLRSGEMIVEGMPIASCLARAKAALVTYQDEHNYIFTSQSFGAIMREVCASGLIGMAPVLHQDTLEGEMTFLSIVEKVGAPI